MYLIKVRKTYSKYVLSVVGMLAILGRGKTKVSIKNSKPNCTELSWVSFIQQPLSVLPLKPRADHHSQNDFLNVLSIMKS